MKARVTGLVADVAGPFLNKRRTDMDVNNLIPKRLDELEDNPDTQPLSTKELVSNLQMQMDILENELAMLKDQPTLMSRDPRSIIAATAGVSAFVSILEALKGSGVTGGVFGWLTGRGEKKKNAAMVCRFGKRVATQAAAVFDAYARNELPMISQDAAALMADNLKDFANDADKAADAILGDDDGK